MRPPSGPALGYASLGNPDVSVAPSARLGTFTEPTAGAGTAVYDITARTVYMPNGERLEAHSGLGDRLDDPRYVHVRMRGATPPGTYTLTEREALFHGVRAVRLNPVGGSAAIHGRAGLLAHTYMLGPNGDSNGCVSFKHYDRFLQAFLRGEVNRGRGGTRTGHPAQGRRPEGPAAARRPLRERHLTAAPRRARRVGLERPGPAHPLARQRAAGVTQVRFSCFTVSAAPLNRFRQAGSARRFGAADVERRDRRIDDPQAGELPEQRPERLKRGVAPAGFISAPWRTASTMARHACGNTPAATLYQASPPASSASVECQSTL